MPYKGMHISRRIINEVAVHVIDACQFNQSNFAMHADKLLHRNLEHLRLSRSFFVHGHGGLQRRNVFYVLLLLFFFILLEIEKKTTSKNPVES